jgi:hypothetical protein
VVYLGAAGDVLAVLSNYRLLLVLGIRERPVKPIFPDQIEHRFALPTARCLGRTPGAPLSAANAMAYTDTAAEPGRS